jgi:hypothetical protein
LARLILARLRFAAGLTITLTLLCARLTPSCLRVARLARAGLPLARLTLLTGLSRFSTLTVGRRLAVRPLAPLAASVLSVFGLSVCRLAIAWLTRARLLAVR